MSQENQIFDKENKENNDNLSIKENIMISSNSNLIDKNENITFKGKGETNENNNSISDFKENNKENINKIKNEENNNFNLSNNKNMVYSESNSSIKEDEKSTNNKNENKSKNVSNLELNYIEMSKQLEELRHESSFLKNKLKEISTKQNNFNKYNKNFSNHISFNKATFINIKKLKNIKYDDIGDVNKRNTLEVDNKIIPNSRNLKKVNSTSKIKLPLFKSFYENNSSPKNNHHFNINKTYINDIKNKILYTDSNSINFNNNNKISLKNNLRLNNDHPTKLFPSNNLILAGLESTNNNYKNLVNEITDKNKLIKKLNHNLIMQNNLAEGKISLLIKNKNKISERLNLIQKEKDDYKSKKESEIKKYIRDLKNDNKIIRELYNEKYKLMKSKRESEILNEKLKNIIIAKRNELKSLNMPKKYSYDITMKNKLSQGNKYINNIKQKYYDINKENIEIKNQILSLKKKLGINQKKELDMKKYMHNIYTFSSSKKLKRPNKFRLFLNENKEKEKKDFNDSISSNEEIEGSFNFENENDNSQINGNSLPKKYHTENTNISNNDTININNEEIKIFNKYINIISENKSNQEKLSELQNELNLKNETIKDLEKKIKEESATRETLLENLKKEKSELQQLLIIEKQKTLKLKLFAEEEQKKHIKYKNKLEKYKKKSKTDEKKLENKDSQEKQETKNPNQETDFFIYSNSQAFDENKNIAKLKEDIFKLKQLLDEEKNKNEVLQLLSENQKEKNEMVKNKYNKTKQLNQTLMNKLKEKEFSINKEIKIENELLKKQLIDTENKNEELKQIIKKLNDEINSYKNSENKGNQENNENNENNEYNFEANPINEIKEEKFKSEKNPNQISSQKNNIKEKKKYSVQISTPTFQGLNSKSLEKRAVPKSNKDVLKPKFQKNKLYSSVLNLKNQKNMNLSNASKKIPSNKTYNNIFIKDSVSPKVSLELNNSDIIKENSDPLSEQKLQFQTRKRKRENSEKVIRIINGNNMSSSEFSSEKNFSDNNKGTKIGIDNVIKENDNEDDDEKINSDINDIKKNKNGDNNSSNDFDNNNNINNNINNEK